jgi:branched-chain amino acid transport system permease protein
MQTIKTRNLNIQYRQAGKGPIKLIFIHGNYASSRWWLPQLARIPPGIQAFAPDLRGCGAPKRITHPLKPSDGILSIKDLRMDLAEFISQLNIKNPILVGHSLGGIIATDYALKYQDQIRGLLLEDTGPPGGLKFGSLAQSILLPLDLGSQIMMRNALRFAGLPRRGSLSKALVEDALAAAPGQYRLFSKAVTHWNVETDLPNFKKPLLLIWGGRDRIMPVRIGQQYTHMMPQAKMVVIPDAGHSPHLERPDAFARVLKQFINQCVSESEITPPAIPPRGVKDRILRRLRISRVSLQMPN